MAAAGAPTPEEVAAEQRRRAAAAAAGGTLALTVSQQPQEPPDSAARTAAAAAILAALVAFLAAQRRRRALWLTQQLSARSRSVQDIERVVAEEDQREEDFALKAAERMMRDLAVTLAIPDQQLRRAAVQALMTREQRYAMQRDDAAMARAVAAIDRVELRVESPQGAFWKLDPTVAEHTAGCLIMGGRFWPWAVLDRVHPPRHAGCPCRLIGYGQAIAEGLLAPGDVMDVRTAIRTAARVVMEGAVVVDAPDGEALLADAATAEYEELRAALEAAGLVDGDALDALEEAFNPGQARYPKGHPKAGQWRPKLGLSGGQVPQSAAVTRRREEHRAKQFDELRTLAAPQRVGTSRVGDGPETPIMQGPTSTAELAAVGKKVAELADRYGTHHAYRQRIDALHEERRKLIDAKSDRIDAAGGHVEVYKRARKVAMGTGKDPTQWIDETFGKPEERARLKTIDAEVSDLLVREEEARRDAIAGVLAEIRPMGGKLGRGDVHRVEGGYMQRVDQPGTLDDGLREVQKFIPKAWIDDSNERGQIDYRLSDERAWHLLEKDYYAQQEAAIVHGLKTGWQWHGYTTGGQGTPWPILRRSADGELYWLDWAGQAHKVEPDMKVKVAPRQRRGAKSTIRIDPKDRDVLLHELMHRFEQVVGDEDMSGARPILRATTRFLRERAGDAEKKKLKLLYPGSEYEDHEETWEDEFVDAYIGKDYKGRTTEVLTMGAQMLFYPRYGRDLMPRKSQANAKADAEMRDFILGILAAL